MLAAFSITPIGTGESVGDLVAETVRIIRASGAPRFGGSEAGPPPGRTERPYPPKGGVDRTEAAGRRLTKHLVSDREWTGRNALKRGPLATYPPSSSSKQAKRCSTCGRSSPPGRCDA